MSCSNDGINASIGCTGPSGLGGANSSSILCGNSLSMPSARAVIDANSSSCQSHNQCSAGWAGINCNVCETNQACSTSSSSTPGTSGSIAGAVSSNLICQKSQAVYTQSFVACDVVNPTLQSIYPGITTLSFSKSITPGLSAYPVLPGSEKSSFVAQLYYAKSPTEVEEEFYCKADSCTQSNSTTIEYGCKNLSCNCIGRNWCSKNGAADLSKTIDGLNGDITISCPSQSTCYFKQSVLQTLFGPNGLSLSSCDSGECVSQNTINTLSSSSSISNKTEFSAGVIAGIAIVGIILLITLLATLLGFRSQLNARRAGRKNERILGTSAGLMFSNIGYALPAKSFFSFEKRSNGRTIISDISGTIKPGEFVSILGPSGSGKSTMLDCLAGLAGKNIKKSGIVYGEVQVIGEDVTIGFVDQESILPATSTVYECLLFAAELKLGDGVTLSVKKARVEEVLVSLGLSKIRDARVGSEEKRGISGGERKRLSIGLELIGVPSILFLDEPTSGLDSSSAFEVISVLKALTTTTTLVTTIHQPSSRMYDAFDKVMLLGGNGKMVYSGPAAQAEAYFKEKGYPLPLGWSIADHLLEIATESFSLHSDSMDILLTPVLEKSAPTSPSTASFDLSSSIRPSGSAAVFLTQFQVLSKRNYRELKRDLSLAGTSFFISVVLGLFVGGIYFHTGITIGGFQSRIGSLFFLGSLIAFSSLSALINFSNSRLLFIRERSATYYSPSAWYLSKILFDIVPLRILPAILMSSIVYWMVGLNPGAAEFFKFLLILIEYSVVTTLFNILLAALVSKAGVAILISSIIILMQMAYAGFFVSISSIPPVLRWIQYLDPLRYTLEALTVNEVNSGLMIVDVLAGVEVDVSASLIMETLFGFAPAAYTRDVLALFGFAIGFSILTLLAVHYKMREVR